MKRMTRAIALASVATAVVAVPSMAQAGTSGTPANGHRSTAAASWRLDLDMDPGGGGGRHLSAANLGRNMDPGGGGGERAPLPWWNGYRRTRRVPGCRPAEMAS